MFPCAASIPVYPYLNHAAAYRTAVVDDDGEGIGNTRSQNRYTNTIFIIVSVIVIPVSRDGRLTVILRVGYIRSIAEPWAANDMSGTITGQKCRVSRIGRIAKI